MMLEPMLAPVLWTFVMCGWLHATRIPAIRRHRIVSTRPGRRTSSMPGCRLRCGGRRTTTTIFWNSRRCSMPRAGTRRARCRHGPRSRLGVVLHRLANGPRRRAGDRQQGHAPVRAVHGRDPRPPRHGGPGRADRVLNRSFRPTPPSGGRDRPLVPMRLHDGKDLVSAGRHHRGPSIDPTGRRQVRNDAFLAPDVARPGRPPGRASCREAASGLTP